MKKRKWIHQLAVFLVAYVTISPAFIESFFWIGEPQLPVKMLKEVVSD